MDLIEPSSKSFVSQRTRLHYTDWGNSEAPPLILLHGGRDHCRSWDWAAKELRKDWRVICPDLRGHGDSEWTNSGHYPVISYVFDLAQLIHQLELTPVTIVAHSLGASVALRYAGLYPENLRRIVAIEGLGPSPSDLEQSKQVPHHKQWRSWIERKRKTGARQPGRYETFEDALGRMQEANPTLSDDRAMHLTRHGVTRNEDGSFRWKFDPHIHAWPPSDFTDGKVQQLWARITCPTLMVYGNDSWASNPVKDGRIKSFGDNVSVSDYDHAGHWVHHDRFDDFITEVQAFIA